MVECRGLVGAPLPFLRGKATCIRADRSERLFSWRQTQGLSALEERLAESEEQMSDALTVLEERIASIADTLCLSSCALLAPPPHVEGNEKNSFRTSSLGMARCDRVCRTEDAMHGNVEDADDAVAAKEVTDARCSRVSSGGMSYEDSTGCLGDELPGKTEEILVADMLRKRMLVLSCRVLSWWSEIASCASQLRFAEMIQVAVCLHTQAFALKHMRSQVCSPADFWHTPQARRSRSAHLRQYTSCWRGLVLTTSHQHARWRKGEEDIHKEFPGSIFVHRTQLSKRRAVGAAGAAPPIVLSSQGERQGKIYSQP